MFTKYEEKGRELINPMIVTVMCLHGLFAGLGLMVLVVIH